MVKRNKLEIIKDILTIIRDNHNSIKITPLIRKTNLSSSSFKEYYTDLIKKSFAREIETKDGKVISITEKGEKFLEKYKTIISFIDEFEL